MRPIDADALREKLQALSYDDWNQGVSTTWAQAYDEVADMVDESPTIVPERKKGRWIKTGQSFVFPEKFRNYSCSECGYDVDKTKFNFCPICGARMVRGEEDGN